MGRTLREVLRRALGVPAAPRIEVLTVRDPDGYTDVSVFIDGRALEYTDETVDAGAGHDRGEWDEYTETVRTTTSYTPAFRDAVLAARQDPPGEQYITDWYETEEPR
jgi:hypothetical protein